jgi:hypothetical protein
MSPGTKRGSASSGSSAKKSRAIKDALLGTSSQVLKSLQAQYKGKRLLLNALSIYGSKARVPTGEESYNFMYRVQDINPCGTTRTTVILIVPTSSDVWNWITTASLPHSPPLHSSISIQCLD